LGGLSSAARVLTPSKLQREKEGQVKSVSNRTTITNSWEKSIEGFWDSPGRSEDGRSKRRLNRKAAINLKLEEENGPKGESLKFAKKARP